MWAEPKTDHLPRWPPSQRSSTWCLLQTPHRGWGGIWAPPGLRRRSNERRGGKREGGVAGGAEDLGKELEEMMEEKTEEVVFLLFLFLSTIELQRGL